MACNRNEYEEYILGGEGGRCVEPTTFPPSCADCLEIWEPLPPGTFRPVQACNRIALPLLLLFFFNLCLSFKCESRRHGCKEKTNTIITEDLTLVVLGDLSVGQWYSCVLCHQAVYQAPF